MTEATPGDTCDHIVGSGALSYSWYKGLSGKHLYHGHNLMPYDDWYVMVHLENPVGEGTVEVELWHGAVMIQAQRVLSSPNLYPALLVSECAHLLYDADAADFDADLADVLIQYMAFGKVVYG